MKKNTDTSQADMAQRDLQQFEEPLLSADVVTQCADKANSVEEFFGMVMIEALQEHAVRQPAEHMEFFTPTNEEPTSHVDECSPEAKSPFTEGENER